MLRLGNVGAAPLPSRAHGLVRGRPANYIWASRSLSYAHAALKQSVNLGIENGN